MRAKSEWDEALSKKIFAGHTICSMHLFNTKRSLSTYHVLITLLGTRDTSENKTQSLTWIWGSNNVAENVVRIEYSGS